MKQISWYYYFPNVQNFHVFIFATRLLDSAQILIDFLFISTIDSYLQGLTNNFILLTGTFTVAVRTRRMQMTNLEYQKQDHQYSHVFSFFQFPQIFISNFYYLLQLSLSGVGSFAIKYILSFFMCSILSIWKWINKRTYRCSNNLKNFNNS